MASNKKAQILAAVMCASSIFGSYTVVSAADTPTKIESTDKNSSVTANGSTITATAGAQGISASATKKDEDGNTTGGISIIFCRANTYSRCILINRCIYFSCSSF